MLIYVVAYYVKGNYLNTIGYSLLQDENNTKTKALFTSHSWCFDIKGISGEKLQVVPRINTTFLITFSPTLCV